MNAAIAERVAAGVAWLDDVLPDWWKTHEIDLDALDMSDGCQCVVGQLYPFDEDDIEHDIEDDGLSPFDAAVNRYWFDLTYPAARERGLLAVGDLYERPDEYIELGDEWRRVITERRAAA